ncbi:helix-turn-helix domain-containing protein [Egibacter rhizosphaerae]|uniref:Helix-turn-helix domain-containing protein n=1 Tax=Egibacter rhizosphaerae TaxID=1670831 RepID=A0A411YHS9_9ACTN|nr:helix-turn-helix domain-containing protein [Egibacter rhizosphaerae]QBI20773.1 helix-turn-helix domain-containing protein [Egibacter rhizosphaerae]
MSATLSGPVEEPLREDQTEHAQQALAGLEDLLARIGDRDLVELHSSEDPAESLQVPAPALRLFRDVLAQLSAGHAVQILPIHAELTTQQAAELLNVSRPHVVKLVEDGTLPARRVGTHRRIRVQDVMDYRRRDDQRRRGVLDDLAEEAEELGLE